ncbi:cellulose biosynthesis protein BcsC [Azomonas macrocytogenes]|uniref:Putative Zn-dependent protease n=1 Tax=Azomonas macrocytogenes TaxID=69962 RepID=A0A839SYX1_AZOMA|nr:cellulose biosynthesis protein BcsC [Azomonas macrocytogenes]MBB3102541.1 putative Zn-dependent protease [Azomonas macrocytogenes]
MAAKILKPLSLAIYCKIGVFSVPAILAAEPSPSSIEPLLQQAEFWQARNRPELAVQTLNRALSVQPDSEEVLYRLALMSLQNDEKAAQGWLQRLRQSHPNSPRIEALEQASKSRTMDRGKLSQTRLLASRGDTSSAIQSYRELFGGDTPPPDMALEYYQTLAGQENTWTEARKGLEQLKLQQPNNPRVQLALARVLSYREPTRREAIGMLAELSRQLPEAQADWRQSLLWLNAGSNDAALYAHYSEVYPADAEIPARFASVQASRQVNPGDTTRLAGFNDLRSGRNSAALANFDQALRHNEKDADAWSGLGIAQLRLQNYGAARTSLGKAIALAPKRRSEWADALANAEFYEQLQAARRQRDTGQLDTAATLAQRLAQGAGDRPRSARLLLGDIQLRQQKLADAEQTYRQVLTEDPRSEPALLGLYGSLLRLGKREQAGDLLRSHPGLAARPLGNLQQTEALALRDRAETLRQQGDTQGAAQAFGEALALAPQNPWVRLSYARFLNTSNEPQQARLMVEPQTQGAVDAEALQAAALFAIDQERWEDASGYLQRIPPGRRGSSEIQALLQRVEVNERIAKARSAVASGNQVIARQALRTLHENTPQDFASRGQVAVALADLGEPAWALSMVRADLRDTDEQQSAAAYLSHVAVLAKTGQAAEADTLMRKLERRSDLSTEDRQGLQELRNGFAVAQADQQRTRGNLAGAYDTLMANLQGTPRDDGLLLAMGRLYQSGKMNKEATAVYDAVLQQSPDNPDAVRGAVDTALASDNPQRASQLLNRVGHALDETTSLVLSARVAAANGENRRAIRLLELARRRQLAKSGQPGVAIGGLTPLMAQDNPFRDSDDPRIPLVMANPRPRYSNPFIDEEDDEDSASAKVPFLLAQGSPSHIPADPLTSEIERNLAVLKDKTATKVQGSIALRSREGDEGLSQLNEVKTPLQLSMVPLENGRIELSATPTYVDAGTLKSGDTSRFGSNAIKGNQLQMAFGLYNEQFIIQSAIELRQAMEAAKDAPFSLEDRATAIATARDNAAEKVRQALIDKGWITEAEGDRLVYALRNSTANDALKPYRPKSQDDAGLGLNLAYTSDSLKADIGTTPLGFEKTNLVGGFKWMPKVGENGQVSLGAERRPVTDSLLSYAGTKDPLTGKTWGGVTRTGVNVQYSYDNGTAGFYAGNDVNVYRGKNVKDNHSFGANAGAYVRPLRTKNQELQTGFNLNWMSYDKNLGEFTLGHGGYFSPQSFVGVSLPVQYSFTNKRWDIKARASLGYQSYNQDSAPYFPGHKSLQSQLEQVSSASTALYQEAGLSAPTMQTRYSSNSDSGIAFNGGASLEYKLGKQTKVGGTVGYDSFGEYSEATGAIYLKHSMEDLP